jgi:hypothetical protein
MSIATVVFIVGLYLVPLVLLAWGHRVRRLNPRARRSFWGAVIGHCIAGTLVMFGMMPPEEWTADQTVRGFIGLWALLVFPTVGAIGGLLTATKRV